MVKSINHIGIAVRAIEDHRSYYENTLGAVFEGMEIVPEQRVKVAFYRVGESPGATRIELLEPTANDSPIARFLEKRGEGLHHIAYTVDDLKNRLQVLKEQGIRLIDETPRKGAHNMSIAFLHPASTGKVLSELCEPRNDT